MQKILEGSLIYRFFTAIFSWVGVQWRENRVVIRFLSPGYGEQMSESSVFTRIWLRFHKWLWRVIILLKVY